MHDFFCSNPDEMYYKELSEKARYFKEDEQGVKAMCRAFQEVRDEGRAEGVAEEKERTALRALKQGLTVEVSASLADLPPEKVAQLAEELKKASAGAGLPS